MGPSLWASQTGSILTGDAIFLVRVARTSTQSLGNDFLTIKAGVSALSPSQDSPSLLVGCSTAPCTSVSPHFTCPTPKALQNSTSAHTSVLICSAPTLGCIPAPFLITLISHTPLHGFSPALLQAHTGPLEPEHVPVPLQSCLIGIFWAENLPCMKNVFLFFFFFLIPHAALACGEESLFVQDSLCLLAVTNANTWHCVDSPGLVIHGESAHTAQVARGRDTLPTTF